MRGPDTEDRINIYYTQLQSPPLPPFPSPDGCLLSPAAPVWPSGAIQDPHGRVAVRCPCRSREGRSVSGKFFQEARLTTKIKVSSYVPRLLFYICFCAIVPHPFLCVQLQHCGARGRARASVRAMARASRRKSFTGDNVPVEPFTVASCAGEDAMSKPCSSHALGQAGRHTS